MDKEIIYEYENVLLGNKIGISPYFFGYSAEQNEKLALEIIRYAVETYLRWSPEQLCECLTWDIIHTLKLEVPMRYVRFPPETDEDRDLFVIAHKLYPDKIRIDLRRKALAVYKKVLAGKLYKFPKGFFDGSKGINRALICLQYALSQYTHFEDVKEMYEYFATSDGAKFLKQYKLYAVSIAMYDYLIDFLHDALSTYTGNSSHSASKSEFWYHYYRFRIINAEQIRNMKKNGTFIA